MVTDAGATLADDLCFAQIGTAASTVTLHNKRREKFRLDVPASLTLAGVVIDGLDSVLHTQSLGTPLPACLSERRACCRLNPSTGVVTNEDAADDATFSCAASFAGLFDTMEADCFANWPRSLFKMRMTDDDQDGISSPNELTLSSYAGVQNVFYAMNSLVSFTSVGGIVNLRSARFSRLHICGSIVKDSFADLGNPNLEDYVNGQYLSADQLSVINTIRGQQASGQTHLEYYMDTVSDAKSASVCDSDATYCTQILINSGSIFQSIPFGHTSRTQARLVSESNGLRNQGYIVTLDSDKWSSLEVYDSQFRQIKAPFDGCGTYESLVADDESQVQPEGSLNNFRQLFNAETDFDKAQVQGPFILRDHKGPVVFGSNFFYENYSYQGAISVVKQEGAFWAQANNFEKNVALVGSNALNVQMGATTIEGSASTRQCGGIVVTGNTFTSNIGCENTNGAISIQCVADDGWSYNSIMDLYDFEDGAALPGYPSEIFTQLSTTVTSTNSQIQETVQANVVLIEVNTFSYNFAGTNRAVVSIEGFDEVTYMNNTHYYNENWITNSYRLNSPLYRE